MLNKKDIPWFFGLFCLEFFLLQGNSIYPFPEIFLAFLFLKAKDKYIIPISFFIGLLMDLSTNSLGVFSFTYTFFSILLKVLLDYTMELDYFKFVIFIIYDVLIKFTNLFILYIKYAYVDFDIVKMGVAVVVDFLSFLVLSMFHR